MLRIKRVRSSSRCSKKDICPPGSWRDSFSSSDLINCKLGIEQQVGSQFNNLIATRVSREDSRAAQAQAKSSVRVVGPAKDRRALSPAQSFRRSLKLRLSPAPRLLWPREFSR